jgi:hypothetical protein
VKIAAFALALAFILGVSLPVSADILQVQNVTEEIWDLVGPPEQRNSEYLGNNATFGLIVTTDGAVLIDPNGSERGASMIDDVVQALTDQPVRSSINTGVQDHRCLGSVYWRVMTESGVLGI